MHFQIFFQLIRIDDVAIPLFAAFALLEKIPKVDLGLLVPDSDIDLALRYSIVGNLVIQPSAQPILFETIFWKKMMNIRFHFDKLADRDVARQKTLVIHLDLRGQKSAEVRA